MQTCKPFAEKPSIPMELTPAPRYFFSPHKNVCNAFVIRVFPSFVTSVISPLAGWHHPSGEPVLIYNAKRRPRWPALYTCCCHHLIGTGGMFCFFFLLFFNVVDGWERCGNTEQMARGRSGALTNDRRVPRCCLSVCRRVSVFSINGPAEGDVHRPFPRPLIQHFLLDFKGILCTPGPWRIMATDCV